MAVTDALKRTPKGRLSYESDWDSRSSTGKQQFLEELSQPTPMSSEIISIIDEQQRRRDLASSTSEKPSKITDSAIGQYWSPDRTADTSVEVDADLEAVDCVEETNECSVVAERKEDFSQSLDDQLLQEQTQDISLRQRHFKEMLKLETNECSVVVEMKEEFNDFSQSLDDQLLQEQAQDISLRQHNFKEMLENIRLKSEKMLKQTLSEQQQLREEDRDCLRAEEQRRRVASQEYMRLLSEENRRWDERTAAVVRCGEEQKLDLIKKQEIAKLAELCCVIEHVVREFGENFSSAYHSSLQPSPHSATLYAQGMSAVQSISTVLECRPNHSQVQDLVVKVTELQLPLDELQEAVKRDNQVAEEQAARLAEREAMRMAAEVKLRSQEEAKRNEEVLRKAAEKLKNEQKAQYQTTGGSDGAVGMASSAIAEYSRLHSVLAKTTASCSSLMNDQDAALKKYRFALQKAIGTQINAISDQSGQHLLDKINRLRHLLSGRPLEVGGRSVSISEHPEAMDYCCNLIAKKLVRQGEDQVASRVNTAFPIAAVAMGIWDEYPLVGDLILAHFYSTCPVLVPFYVPKTDSMTEAEHLKLQGYKVLSDGSVESSDLFLKRMSGLVRLYAAIVQSEPPNPSHKNPHGLEHGWVWFARMLNSDPHPTLTANALHDFLEVAGHALMKCYNKQFRKLLLLLCKDYVPKITQITPESQRGPLARLTQFLEDCISTGRVAQPKGCLSANFWRTRSQGIQMA